MSETLTETFARFAENAEFQQWNLQRTPEVKVVYVSNQESVWKFSPAEWWSFVKKAIRNDGAYKLPQSNQLKGYCKKVADVESGVSRDCTIRSVNLNRWTLTNWTEELQAI